MKEKIDNMKLFGVFILFLILFIALSGFYLNRQVLPSLDNIVSITKNINSTKEIFVPARGSWNWIDLRLANAPVRFAINGNNIINSNSETYQRIRRSLSIGNEITLWAVPKGPTMSEAFFFTNINRKPLHELNIDKPENTSSGLGNFQEIKKVNYDDEALSYDVVQIVMNGQTLLPYKIYAENKQRVDKQSFWLWIIFGITTLILGLMLIYRHFSNTKHKKN